MDAANAIFVGATLIASVTFAAWLQPPLGYSEFYGSTSIDVGAPLPSGMYPSFVSVAGHPTLDIFWIFNSMSFLFAIATLMVGASAARPPKQDKDIGEVVRTLRRLLSLAYSLLTASVACVLGAFASAGFVVLPPVRRYTVTMGATLGIGLLVVLISTWTPSWIISSWISSKVLYALKIIKAFFATILDLVEVGYFGHHKPIFSNSKKKNYYFLNTQEHKYLHDSLLCNHVIQGWNTLISYPPYIKPPQKQQFSAGLFVSCMCPLHVYNIDAKIW